MEVMWYSEFRMRQRKFVYVLWRYKEDLSAGNVLRRDDVGCGEKACQEDNKWGKVSMDGSQVRSNYDSVLTKLPERQRAGTYAIITYSFVRFPSLCIAAKHQAFSQWERVMKTLSPRRRHVSMDTNSQARKLRRNRALLTLSF